MEELLDQEGLEIARGHPLDLETVRESLAKLCHAPSVASFSSSISQQDQDQSELKDIISEILFTLQGHPVAKKVLLRWNGKPLNGELASIYSLLQSQKIELFHFRPLITCIQNKAGDIKLWSTVLQFLSHFSQPRTPPRAHSRSTALTYGGTPYVGSSGSIQSSDQTRKRLKNALVDELSSCTYQNVEHFEEKYFQGNKIWSKQCKDIFTEMKADYNNGQWKGLSKAPSGSEMWQWIDDFQTKHLDATRNKYFSTTTTAEIQNEERKSQIDILLKRRDVPNAPPHSVSDILVVGELTMSSVKGQKDKNKGICTTGTWKEKFLQLAISVRDVFSHQRTRRFVHGFILWRTDMQLWIFDRSGAFASDIFNIHQEPQRFITALTAYAFMNDYELGLDLFISRKGPDPAVYLFNSTTGSTLEFQLEKEPITYQPTIVSRATVCYRTKDQKHIIKFSWQSDKRQPEQDILQDLAKYKIKGVPSLLGSHVITSITDERRGLTFNKPHVFRKYSDVSTQSFLDQLPQGLQKSGLQESDGSSSKKRKSFETQNTSSKRSKSYDQLSSLSRCWANDNACSRLTDGGSELDHTRKQFRGRLYTCLAISPAGRPLSSAQSPLELLAVFRDSIDTHRSVLLDGKYLHRDISDNNIIISEPGKNSGKTGLLIDFDMAVKVDNSFTNEKTRAEFMTGTRKFMALEVLEASLTSCSPETEPIQPTTESSHRRPWHPPRGINRTYKHDLESFFYVFLSICISYGWDGNTRRKHDPLSGWYLNDIGTQIAVKRGHMDKTGFRKLILAKFSPRFQELKCVAQSLRDIIFEREEGRNTYSEHPSELYNRVIQAFEHAISDLESSCRVADSKSNIYLKTSSSGLRLSKRKYSSSNMFDTSNVNNIQKMKRSKNHKHDNFTAERELPSESNGSSLGPTQPERTRMPTAKSKSKTYRQWTLIDLEQATYVQVGTGEMLKARRSARLAS